MLFWLLELPELPELPELDDPPELLELELGVELLELELLELGVELALELLGVELVDDVDELELDELPFGPVGLSLSHPMSGVTPRTTPPPTSMRRNCRRLSALASPASLSVFVSSLPSVVFFIESLAPHGRSRALSS